MGADLRPQAHLPPCPLVSDHAHDLRGAAEIEPVHACNRDVDLGRLSVDMDVKNNGIKFQVHSNAGAHLGGLYTTRTGLIWSAGRIHKDNGKRISRAEFAAPLASAPDLGDPGVIRTRGLRFRKPLLYPAELRGRVWGHTRPPMPCHPENRLILPGIRRTVSDGVDAPGSIEWPASLGLVHRHDKTPMAEDRRHGRSRIRRHALAHAMSRTRARKRRISSRAASPRPAASPSQTPTPPQPTTNPSR